MNYIAKKIALQEKNILNHADLYLDYNNRIAFHKNRKINLTVKEFDILFFLASYPGQVFTHRQIYETVWGKEYFCDEGNVTAHIGHIRKKIELDPRNPVFIQRCMQEAVVTPSIHAVSRDGARFMVVIIGLVIIFKKQLNELVTKIFEKITNESSGI